MSRAIAARLLILVALLGAGLASTTAHPADHRSVVDLTFPAAPDARFSDDYDSGRSGGRVHRATDLLAPMGSPVYAARGGQVTWAPGRHASAGYALQITGDDGRLYAYYHLGPHTGSQSEAYAPGIAAGVQVRRGQHIGYVGDSGNAAGGAPHLHFEIHDTEITDPAGTHRRNPYASLADAIRRGDVVGRTDAAPVSRDTGRDPVLRLGDHGSAVAAWQAQLNSAAGAGLATDGAFGPATDRATRDFQRARGLVVDGIVGPASRAALGATATPVAAPPPAGPDAGPAPSPAPVASEDALLRMGDRGPAVATWQDQLNRATGAGLVTDGEFGPATDRATREFQRARGISVDGIVGPRSRAALTH